jgi:HlyD family secretion protein
MRTTSGFSLVKWLVIVGVVGVVGFYGYRYFQPAGGTAAVNYRTATVAKGDILQTVIANGSLTPVRMVEVGSQISGTITEIKADFNSTVKSGDILAQIDPATYERALGQAEAELANAEAARELAKLNADRAQELFSNSLISKSEYDSARIGLLQADANVKTRVSNVERARVDLDRTTIYATMDGVIISRKVEAGQTVAASMNAPTLFIMANDLAHMQIEAAVSEADVGGLKEDQKVTFKVDAFPSRQFAGVVQQVRFEPTTNQNVISYTTIVAVDNKDLKLRPGMTADARFITAERLGVVTVPNAALRFSPPEGAIIKDDPNAPAGSASEKPSVELATSGPFAGLPVQPWSKGGQFRRPTDEERNAYEASLTPEQKEKYQKTMAEFRARMAQGGGPGGGGGGGQPGGGSGGAGRRRAETEAPKSGTVYLIENETTATGGEKVVLQRVTIKLGITDGTTTEVLEGLKEGDVLAVGTATAAVAPTSNPLNPFSNRRR